MAQIAQKFSVQICELCKLAFLYLHHTISGHKAYFLLKTMCFLIEYKADFDCLTVSVHSPDVLTVQMLAVH